MPVRTELVRVARPHLSYNVDVNRAPSSSPLSEPLIVSWENSRNVGSNVRDYRRVIARGGNATTSLSATERSVEIIPGSGGAERWYKLLPKANTYQGMAIEGHRCLFADGNAWPGTGLAMDNSVAINQALTNYYQGVKAVETKLSGLTILGELRESLRMVRRPAQGLRDGLSDYLRTLRVRGSRMRPGSRLDMVRRTWLEYSFGWTPLVSDLNNAITAFFTSDAVKPIFEMVKGTGRDKRIVNRFYWEDSFGLLSSNCMVTTTEEVFVKYFGVYRSEGNGSSNLHHYGFRPSEFVPTLWELIPYSFLVDYFTNIGEILESWSYRFLRPDWTARTIRREGIRKTSQEAFHMYQFSPSTYENVVWGSPGRQTWREKSVERTPLVPLDLPSLEVKVPGNWRQWANIAALTSQLSSTRSALRP